MSTPAPPVPIQNACSIIYNNTLYVYSPNAFQILPLVTNATWSQQANGVSVTGAVCVKGGIDGDSTRPALYVIGGQAPSSPNYPGLQRYSIVENTWDTITPVVPVTQNRLHHGAAYMNASSAIVVYGGSQGGDANPSTETFLIELYPPYRTQSYPSLVAPPVVDPVMLTWDSNQALMLGGSASNVNIFLFWPGSGWQDLGLALPNPIPPTAECALLTLDDDSKILETFNLAQSPNTVVRNVLQNPGGQPATPGQTVRKRSTPGRGSSHSNPLSRKRKRDTSLAALPPYNATFAPSTARTGATLAQDGEGLIAIVGGDPANAIAIFNQTGNGWLNATEFLLGPSQRPLTSTSSSVSSATASATAPPTVSGNPSATSSAAAAAGSDAGQSHGLIILGAVLGGICGVAAMLIILLLWLRSVRRRRRKSETEERPADYPRDRKRHSELSMEEDGSQPLSKAGQPMGRSPVTSVNPPHAEQVASIAAANRAIENPLAEQRASTTMNRLKVDAHATSGRGPGMFKREKSPLAISKPMLPDLGHYQDRPSIELGKATPATTIPTAAMPMRNISQRKTDEGWGKYFAGGAVGGAAAGAAAAANTLDPNTNRHTYTSHSSRSTSSRGGGGFWPGSGVPEPTPRSPKFMLRDSSGNALDTQTVTASSPAMENGPSDGTRHLAVAEGIPAKISSADSISDTNDDDLEDASVLDDDDRPDRAYSSGIPSSVHDSAWTPVGNTWSGPPQRPLRPPSANTFFPLPTPASSHTNSTDAERSSIPSFPMPSSTTRPAVQPTTTMANGLQAPAGTHFATTMTPPVRPANRPTEDVRDYFSTGVGRDGMPTNSNLSWLNLGHHSSGGGGSGGGGENR